MRKLSAGSYVEAVPDVTERICVGSIELLTSPREWRQLDAADPATRGSCGGLSAARLDYWKGTLVIANDCAFVVYTGSSALLQFVAFRLWGVGARYGAALLCGADSPRLQSL